MRGNALIYHPHPAPLQRGGSIGINQRFLNSPPPQAGEGLGEREVLICGSGLPAAKSVSRPGGRSHKPRGNPAAEAVQRKTPGGRHARTLLPSAAAPAEDLPWPDDSAAHVNEGALAFLPTPPAKPAHHHSNRLTLTEASLKSGWVKLEQCHENLNPVPLTQIVFGQGRIRALQITSRAGIGKARVEGPTVQLEDVKAGARLCLGAERRALAREKNGWVLRNGPYMRRFLDGYYPMHVTMEVRFGEARRGCASPALPPSPKRGSRWRKRKGKSGWMPGSKGG